MPTKRKAEPKPSLEPSDSRLAKQRRSAEPNLLDDIRSMTSGTLALGVRELSDEELFARIADLQQCERERLKKLMDLDLYPPGPFLARVQRELHEGLSKINRRPGNPGRTLGRTPAEVAVRREEIRRLYAAIVGAVEACPLPRHAHARTLAKNIRDDVQKTSGPLPPPLVGDNPGIEFRLLMAVREDVVAGGMRHRRTVPSIARGILREILLAAGFRLESEDYLRHLL